LRIVPRFAAICQGMIAKWRENQREQASGRSTGRSRPARPTPGCCACRRASPR